ncbi:MAG TPA: hypothetical protein VMU17_00765 [Elusimicrobiota bacterium]|nr:hypothetical protein [Elusimicrobiota bacterium]
MYSPVKTQQREQLRRTQVVRKQAASQASEPRFVSHAWEFIRGKSHAILALAGVAVVIAGAAYYLSPLTRLKLNGIRLRLGEPGRESVLYLVGIQSDMKSWAFRDGRMDTPLNSAHVSETGTVVVSAGAPGTVNVRAQEWIKSTDTPGHGTVQQVIAPEHPSLAATTIGLDPEGTLVQRAGTQSARVGRSMNFLFPYFPKGNQRPGHTWSEHIAWNETSGEWAMTWQADLKWTLADFEPCYDDYCARLTYEARLVPALTQRPNWAPANAGDITFEGAGSGEAVYNPKRRRVISNRLAYKGAISVPIPRLEDVPWDQRVGNYTTTGPGVVRIELDNQVDIRSP